MAKPFVHPSDVSVFRAFAVHRIMHNSADKEDWDVMDEWVLDAGLDKVVNDVVRVIEMNAPETDLEAERKWWASQLSDLIISRTV